MAIGFRTLAVATIEGSDKVGAYSAILSSFADFQAIMIASAGARPLDDESSDETLTSHDSPTVARIGVVS